MRTLPLKRSHHLNKRHTWDRRTRGAFCEDSGHVASPLRAPRHSTWHGCAAASTEAVAPAGGRAFLHGSSLRGEVRQGPQLRVHET